MTIFAHGRCPVGSCIHNHGERGVSCAFAGEGSECRHPRHKIRWHELSDGVPPESGPVSRSLTQRAVSAQRAAVELSPVEARQRAQQLALQLEV